MTAVRHSPKRTPREPPGGARIENDLGGNSQIPNSLQEVLKRRLRSAAHGSVRIQEGEPNKSKTYPHNEK